MTERKIPFSPPDVGEAEARAVAEALLSGWITTGPRTKELEGRLAAYCHTQKCICLNSATACLETALRILGVGEGDEVIVPAYTYTATAAAALHVGARVVLVDAQPGDVEMDSEALASAISPRTKVIVPVDLGGIVARESRIREIIEAKRSLFRPSNVLQEKIGRICILADAAHALGAQQEGRMCGEIADLTAFSFHAVKNFTTAEGGALTWNLPFGEEKTGGVYPPQAPGAADETWNACLYRMGQLLSLHGQNKDALAKTKAGAWEYDIVAPWYKCNMTDIMAAIGLVQLDRYPALLKRRESIIRRYDSVLRPLGLGLREHYGPSHCSSGHLYMVRIPGIGHSQRDAIIERMALRGVATNVHYKPLPMLSAYRNLGFSIASFPNALALFENEISLPLHTRLSDEDADYVLDCFTRILAER